MSFLLLVEPASQPEPIAHWVEGAHLLLRRGDEADNVVWARLEGRHIGNWLDSMSRKPRDFSSEAVEKSWNAHRMWRTQTLADGERVFLKPDFGLIGHPSHQFFVRFDFYENFKSKTEILLCDGKRVRCLVEQLEADDNSDLHAARRWIADYQNDWSEMHFERGSRQELEILLSALVQGWRAPGEIGYRWHHRLEIKAPDERLHFPIEFSMESRSAAEQKSLRRIYALLNEYFVARRDKRAYGLDGIRIKHLWLRAVETTAPSMHDRMEAQLNLCDWLRGKMPDAEIESLFKTSTT